MDVVIRVFQAFAKAMFSLETILTACVLGLIIFLSLYFSAKRHVRIYDDHRCPTCGQTYSTKKGVPIDWAAVRSGAIRNKERS